MFSVPALRERCIKVIVYDGPGSLRPYEAVPPSHKLNCYLEKIILQLRKVVTDEENTREIRHSFEELRYCLKCLDGHDEYLTIVSLMTSETECKHHSLKSFQVQLFSNRFVQIKVSKFSDNNSTGLVTLPCTALLRFNADVSPALVEIQQLSKTDVSDTKNVLEIVEKLKGNFQGQCKQTGSHSCGSSGKNGVINRSQSSRGTSYRAQKPMLLSEEEKSPMLTEVEHKKVCNFIGSLTVLRQSRQCQSPISLSEKGSQTEKENELTSRGTQTSSKVDDEMRDEILKLRGVVRDLEHDLQNSNELLESTRNEYKRKVADLTKANETHANEISSLRNKLKNIEDEMKETLSELGRVSVERTILVNEKKRVVDFSKTFLQNISDENTSASTRRNDSNGETLTLPTSQSKPDEILPVNGDSTESNPEIRFAISVQESHEEHAINLSRMPTTTIERSLYNNYKLLLLTIADRLLFDDVVKLKNWATSKFSVHHCESIEGIFSDLDRKGIIGATNLECLREFFEKILRIDLVHLIDCFVSGNYSNLRKPTPRPIDGFPRGSNRYVGDTSSEASQMATAVSITHPSTSGPDKSKAVTEPAGQSSPERKSSKSDSNMTHTSSVSSTPPPRTACRSPQLQNDMGSNGKKLSKFPRPRNQGASAQDSDDGLDGNNEWLCSHYKRRCYVKFSCCNRYWPCHRCHNNESKCGEKKLRSRDTQFVKCVKCGTQQQFGEKSQFCTNCHMKFSKYFCSICKHLTGTDDNPYHCSKCGICRIHQDRSFHCDVCGVCLDRQLLGNHKCRAGSAHDECCICLEDAFSGCQILPCSHKVHKECATQMIRRGITRCPICRESFAHKLEKRYLPSSKKQREKH